MHSPQCVMDLLWYRHYMAEPKLIQSLLLMCRSSRLYSESLPNDLILSSKA